MAGSPKKRKRREEAELGGTVRARRADVATRRRALRRASEVGDAATAAEFGCAPATIRSWRRRMPAEPVDSQPDAKREPAADMPIGDGRLDGMRRALGAHRRVEAQAITAAERYLREDNATEARNAATTAGVACDKALNLERAILVAEGEQEAQEARLRSDQLALQRDVMAAMFEAVDLPPPMATMRELAARAAAGEALAVSAEVASPDRERLRAAIRGELLADVRAQVLEELEAEVALPARDDAGDGEQDAELIDDGEHHDEEPFEDAELVEEEPDADADWSLEAFADPEDGPMWQHEASRRRIEARRQFEQGGGSSRLVGEARPSVAAPLRSSPPGGPGGLA
jgi:hypothetical protein